MFKWVSWALRIVATAVLLSFLCIWTTGYIVNSYMESLIKQFDLPLETKPLALSGVWGTLWGAEKAPKQVAEDEPAKESSRDEQKVAHTLDREDAPETEGHAHTGMPEDDAEDEPASIDDTGADAPASSQDAEPSNVDAPDNAIPVMGDTIELTDEQRQSLYATVVSKLDAAGLQLLSEVINGGATPEKMNQLRAMLQSALTDAEYAQMLEVLKGLS